MRPGCNRPATASFEFDALARTVVLLDDSAAGSQLLCADHARRFTPPTGWELRDERRPEPPEPGTGTGSAKGGVPKTRARKTPAKKPKAPAAEAAPDEAASTPESAAMPESAATPESDSAPARDDDVVPAEPVPKARSSSRKRSSKLPPVEELTLFADELEDGADEATAPAASADKPTSTDKAEAAEPEPEPGPEPDLTAEPRPEPVVGAVSVPAEDEDVPLAAPEPGPEPDPRAGSDFEPGSELDQPELEQRRVSEASTPERQPDPLRRSHPLLDESPDVDDELRTATTPLLARAFGTVTGETGANPGEA